MAISKMTFSKKLTRILPIMFIPIVFAYGKKPLTDRLLNIDDPAYYEAVDEMNALPLEEKKNLAGDLEKIYAQRKSFSERANAVSALGDLSHEVPAALPVLKKALADDHQFVRQAALSGLERTGDHSAEMLKLFVKALSDKDKTVQAKALVAIGNFGKDGKSATADLQKFANDKDENIREIAKASLAAVQQPAQK